MKLIHDIPFGRLLFLVCLAAASPAQAGLIASSGVVYEEGLWNGRVVNYGPTVIGGGPSAVGYNSTNVPGLATSGYALASYHSLHASAFSGVTNPGVGATSETRGQGSAYWIDQLTYTKASLTGQSAFARATFSLSGGLNSLSEAGTFGNSTIAARITVDGDRVFYATGQLISREGAITTDYDRCQSVNGGGCNLDPVSDLAGIFSFDIPFVFGTAFTMTGSLDAFTQAVSWSPGKVASAYSNFGSSGVWGGISQVHLADGTVLSDYNLSSASGFDWAGTGPSSPPPPPPSPPPVSTVPVPGTLWLCGVGLLSLIGMGRRNSKTA
jgi:hypothetical protein